MKDDERTSEKLQIWRCSGDVHWICECKLSELNKYKADAENHLSQMRVSLVEEHRLCEMVFTALASIKYPTPREGFGTNVSWAIHEIVSALLQDTPRDPKATSLNIKP